MGPHASQKAGNCYTRRNLRCGFVFGAEIRFDSLGSHQSAASSGQCLSVPSDRKMRGSILTYIFVCIEKAPSFSLGKHIPQNRMGDDDILLYPISSHSSSSYYGVCRRAVGRFADAIDSRNEEGGLLGDYTERTMLPMNSSQLCAQVYLYKGYLQDRYNYQLENRHPVADGT